ncbi:predicted protein [Histoplasma capsulatum G186AR]|uniref:Uncharacterized protein n=1 Tax=Ajellomyces capsulatus (strain G186AR / H82 / ATCC MYA-2454 / RMSCC 2432) TaxID=447093 RepID=C0NMY6_AJECG|nr:uncharacterized protein HCBG_04113 [Histoplasma capsulatum G186AR]EEH07234.1 predicted protein [Histoplasma capsulatum G186AR]
MMDNSIPTNAPNNPPQADCVPAKTWHKPGPSLSRRRIGGPDAKVASVAATMDQSIPRHSAPLSEFAVIEQLLANSADPPSPRAQTSHWQDGCVSTGPSEAKNLTLFLGVEGMARMGRGGAVFGFNILLSDQESQPMIYKAIDVPTSWPDLALLFASSVIVSGVVRSYFLWSTYISE